MIRWVALVALMLVGSVAQASDVNERFDRANELFESSVAQLGKDDSAATDGLRRSAAMYEAIVEQDGVVSSDVLTNAANARLLAGETGQAIVLYHSALRLDGSDENARANLEIARTRVSADASIERSTPVLEVLTGWRRSLSPTSRAVIAVGAWSALWLWIGLWVTGVRFGGWISVALPLGAIACVSALTLVADSAVMSGPPVGVVITNETVGRTGPDSAVYDPSFTKPLPEGVEFVVLERRAGWALGRLSDGRETWIDERDVELVGV